MRKGPKLPNKAATSAAVASSGRCRTCSVVSDSCVVLTAPKLAVRRSALRDRERCRRGSGGRCCRGDRERPCRGGSGRCCRGGDHERCRGEGGRRRLGEGERRRGAFFIAVGAAGGSMEAAASEVTGREAKEGAGDGMAAGAGGHDDGAATAAAAGMLHGSCDGVCCTCGLAAAASAAGDVLRSCGGGCNGGVNCACAVARRTLTRPGDSCGTSSNRCGRARKKRPNVSSELAFPCRECFAALGVIGHCVAKLSSSSSAPGARRRTAARLAS